MKDFENRLNFDLELIKDYDYIVGIDEAGWGSIAGPISVGFSIIPKKVLNEIKILSEVEKSLKNVKDSKRISESKRTKIIEVVKDLDIKCYIKLGTVQDINTIGMADSLDKAINEGLLEIPQKSLILMDGSRKPKLDYNFHMVTKGDDKSWTIALASIFAKTLRDNIMKSKPNKDSYQWEKNKGYATKSHIEAIKDLGLSDDHRINACRNFVKKP